MSKLNLKGTSVLQKILETNRRFLLSVGSSRSSKTFSQMQWIIIECLKRANEGIFISVVRASFPSLRRTVYREFVELLKEYGLYDVNKHNKTEHVIEIAGNYVEFFSLSDSQKVRGAKRNHLYLNECNEIDYESAQQLFLRTSERIFMDMNPSDIWHWSWKMKDRNDVDYIHSTYKDNGFLTEATVKQIESYKDSDENFYRVYALGLPGFSTTTIYTHWQTYKINCLEDGTPLWEDYCYGLDVGYSHAMALTKGYFRENTVWVEEIIYKEAITSSDLIKMMNDLQIEKDKDIWVDAAAAMMIEDLKRAGYNAKKALKDVKEGIDLIKSKKLFIHEDSFNLINEIRRYSWKTKNEQIIYEPVKLFDDGMDSMRYLIYNYFKTTERINAYDFDIEIVTL
jgi:phage terminase large subunit